MSSELVTRIVDLAIEIQQIPAPTFEEAERAAFLAEIFLQEGLQEVSVDPLQNVFARLPGRAATPPVVVAAHLDTVFPAGTDLAVQRDSNTVRGPGIGDNALGVASLLGLVWDLQTQSIPLPGDLILAGNVGEEGLGNSTGMQTVVDRFADRPLAYIVVEGMALGHIFNRGMRVKRYRIQMGTAGGHSWVDYGQPSAVHELARLVTEVASINLMARPRTTLNVGKMDGGLSVNSIASRASIELDLRSESSESLDILVGQVERIVSRSNRNGVRATMDLIGDRPTGILKSGHPLVKLAQRCLREQGIDPQLNIGSTDANIPLSRGYPAVCIGLTTGGGAHTLEEYINLAPLNSGVAQLTDLVRGLYQM